jgi:cyclic beta-1,2-glucan glucanotransferase
VLLTRIRTDNRSRGFTKIKNGDDQLAAVLLKLFHTTQLSDVRSTSVAAQTPIRVFGSPDTPIPEVQLLSNGRYRVMVSNAGGGYSRWKDLAVTRWREDGTCDHRGSLCYIREIPNGTSGTFWSIAHQPPSTPR